MRIRLAFTLDVTRRRREEPEEDFEHRDVETVTETAFPGPSVVPMGFTPGDPDDRR